MKKLTKALAAGIACLLMMAALTVPALAEPRLDNVTDAAMVLTDEQYTALDQKAKAISDQYQCGVYIITLDDFTAYVDTDKVEIAAKSIYDEYDLGTGDDKSGILLLLSIAGRDYTLLANGYGNTAFTDFGKNELADTFLDNFKNDDWNGGFADYLDKSAAMLETARAGKPVDVEKKPPAQVKDNPKAAKAGLFVSLALGCAVAGIICLIMRSGMRSVAKSTQADAYIPAENIAFTRRDDTFTHTTEVRTKVEENKGGTTTDTSGHSTKSGKF